MDKERFRGRVELLSDAPIEPNESKKKELLEKADELLKLRARGRGRVVEGEIISFKQRLEFLNETGQKRKLTSGEQAEFDELDLRVNGPHSERNRLRK